MWLAWLGLFLCLVLFLLQERLAVFEFADQGLSVQSQVPGVGLEGPEHVHGWQYVEVLVLKVTEVPDPDLRRLLDLLEGEPSLFAGLLQSPSYLLPRMRATILAAHA